MFAVSEVQSQFAYRAFKVRRKFQPWRLSSNRRRQSTASSSYLNCACATPVAMSTIMRTLRNIRRIGLKEYAHQMQYQGPQNHLSHDFLSVLPNPFLKDSSLTQCVNRRHKSRKPDRHRPLRQQILREHDRRTTSADTVGGLQRPRI